MLKHFRGFPLHLEQTPEPLTESARPGAACAVERHLPLGWLCLQPTGPPSSEPSILHPHCPQAFTGLSASPRSGLLSPPLPLANTLHFSLQTLAYTPYVQNTAILFFTFVCFEHFRVCVFLLVLNTRILALDSKYRCFYVLVKKKIHKR